MRPDLKAATEGLAVLNSRRSASGWARRAWEEAGQHGELEEAESRMLAWTEDRIAEATERKALQIRIQVFKRSDRLDAETERLARERIHRDGGITHDRARELGFESVADFLRRRPGG